MNTVDFELTEGSFLEFDKWIRSYGFEMVVYGMTHTGGVNLEASMLIAPRKGEGGAVYYIFVCKKTGYLVVVRTIWLLKSKRVTRDKKKGWVLIVPIKNPDHRAHSSIAITRTPRFWEILKERTIVAREIVIQVPNCIECHARTEIKIDNRSGKIGDRHFVCPHNWFHPSIHWNALQHSKLGWKRLLEDRASEKRNRRNPNVKEPGSARKKRKRWKRLMPNGEIVLV